MQEGPGFRNHSGLPPVHWGVRTSSDRRRQFRARAVAGAVLAGAGLAFAHAVTGATAAGPILAAAAGGHGLPDPAAPNPGPVPAREPVRPAPNPTLPFNAKLTSDDIPVPGGG